MLPARTETSVGWSNFFDHPGHSSVEAHFFLIEADFEDQGLSHGAALFDLDTARPRDVATNQIQFLHRVHDAKEACMIARLECLHPLNGLAQ